MNSSDSFSDSSEEEIPTSWTLSPVPKPPRHLISSPAHIPTLETASPVTKPDYPLEQYGAFSIPSCVGMTATFMSWRQKNSR